MPKVKVSDGTEISYYVDDFVEPWIEEKDTIIMLHGCAEDAEVFKPMVPALASKYRVIRFDERGMGKSSIPPGGYKASTKRFVEDILNLVDHLGINRFHLLGQSSGGIIAMSFAIAHPDRLKSLILCQTPYYFPEEIAARYRLGEKDVGTAIRKYGFREWQKRVPDYRVFDLTKTDPKIVEWYDEYRAKNPVEAVAGRYDWVFSVEDLSARLKEIKVPTLLIHGEGSYQTTAEQVSFIQQQIPNIKSVTINDGFGQCIHIVVPDLVAEKVLDFLKTIN